MKTKIYLLLLLALLTSQSNSQTVSFVSSVCGTHQFVFSFVDATGRNFLGGITDALSWNASTNQWEWTDYGSSPPVTYYTNSYPSSPNPPCFNTGTWVQLNGNCGTLTAITGDCQTSLTSINENALPGGFSFTSNPVSGEITVLSSAASSVNMTICVLNSLGEIIYRNTFPDRKTVINLSDQSKGIYFVQLQNQDGFFCKKIIVSN